MELKDDEFLLIRDFVANHFGVYFADEKRSLLQSELSRIIPADYKSFFDYYQRIMERFFHQQAFFAHEIMVLIRANNNHEPSLFKAHVELKALREVIAVRRGKPMRALSAGCSTGEEAYALAVLMREGGIPAAASGVVGIDLDAEAIREGISGTYRYLSFQGVKDPGFFSGMNQYFNVSKLHETIYEVKTELKKTVTFQQANIVDPASLGPLGTFDIIMCRNVLCHFEATERKRTIENLYEVLNPGGYLCLGETETLDATDRVLKPVKGSGPFLYQKGGVL